mmetsp:Transcript_40892/g.118393  ORF Transcript_40892/g.118393 Transcript_40892/m.118393 type:complete len:534 (-) Transcript_40892:105-1706(-)
MDEDGLPVGICAVASDETAEAREEGTRHSGEVLGAVPVALAGSLPEGLAQDHGDQVQRQQDDQVRPQQSPQAADGAVDEHHQLVEDVQPADPQDAGNAAQSEDAQRPEEVAGVGRSGLVIHPEVCQRSHRFHQRHHHQDGLEGIPCGAVRAAEELPDAAAQPASELGGKHDRESGVDDRPPGPIRLAVDAHADRHGVGDDEQIHDDLAEALSLGRREEPLQEAAGPAQLPGPVAVVVAHGKGGCGHHRPQLELPPFTARARRRLLAALPHHRRLSVGVRRQLNLGRRAPLPHLLGQRLQPRLPPPRQALPGGVQRALALGGGQGERPRDLRMPRRGPQRSRKLRLPPGGAGELVQAVRAQRQALYAHRVLRHAAGLAQAAGFRLAERLRREEHRQVAGAAAEGPPELGGLRSRLARRLGRRPTDEAPGRRQHNGGAVTSGAAPGNLGPGEVLRPRGGEKRPGRGELFRVRGEEAGPEPMERGVHRGLEANRRLEANHRLARGDRGARALLGLGGGGRRGRRRGRGGHAPCRRR